MFDNEIKRLTTIRIAEKDKGIYSILLSGAGREKTGQIVIESHELCPTEDKLVGWSEQTNKPEPHSNM